MGWLMADVSSNGWYIRVHARGASRKAIIPYQRLVRLKNRVSFIIGDSPDATKSGMFL